MRHQISIKKKNIFIELRTILIHMVHRLKKLLITFKLL